MTWRFKMSNLVSELIPSPLNLITAYVIESTADTTKVSIMSRKSHETAFKAVVF